MLVTPLPLKEGKLDKTLGVLLQHLCALRKHGVAVVAPGHVGVEDGVDGLVCIWPHQERFGKNKVWFPIIPAPKALGGGRA